MLCIFCRDNCYMSQNKYHKGHSIGESLYNGHANFQKKIDGNSAKTHKVLRNASIRG